MTKSIIPGFEQLEKLLLLPWSAQFTIRILPAVVVLGVFFGIMYPTTSKLVTNKQAEVVAYQGLLQATKEAGKDLPRFEKELITVEKEMNLNLSKLPREAHIPEILDSVSEVGKEAGLNFKRFQPAQPVNKGLYYDIPINIKAQGTYGQLLGFLKGLSKVKRIIDIKILSIKIRKTGRVDLTGQVVTYMANKSNTEKAEPQ